MLNVITALSIISLIIVNILIAKEEDKLNKGALELLKLALCIIFFIQISKYFN